MLLWSTSMMRRPVPPPDHSLPFHVYLSHAHDDFLLVDRLWRILDRLGLRAYMYEHFPHPGRAASEAVAGALRDSHHVISFLTEAGAGSAWLHQELGAAFALGKYLMPVVQAAGAVQAAGFVTLQQPILYDPRRPEVTLGRVLWLLRVDFERFEGQLSVQCPSCQAHFYVALPPMQLVRQGMDQNKLLGKYPCSACQQSVHLSPWTLEPISEQMALGRAWAE